MPKALLELADELEKLGWRCRIASDEEICPGIWRSQARDGTAEFSDALGRSSNNTRRTSTSSTTIIASCFERARFNPITLLVARVSLLHHHFETIHIPPMPGLRHRIAAVVKRNQHLRDVKDAVGRANRALEAADLVNVSNDYDRTELAGRGFNPRRSRCCR